MANKSFPVGPDDPAAPAPDSDTETTSFDTFRKVMSSFIDDFFTSFDLLPLSVFEDAGMFVPKVSVTHDQHAVTVIAELPGMEASDIEVTLGGDTLMIQGQRKRSRQGKGAGISPDDFHTPFFRKMIPLPFFIDAQNARATFQGRVLRVMLPRRPGDHPSRIRIPIKA
jgi:HSP20 family protein